MKQKVFKNGVTFFSTDEMYDCMKRISGEREISLGQLIREALERHLFEEDLYENNK